MSTVGDPYFNICTDSKFSLYRENRRLEALKNRVYILYKSCGFLAVTERALFNYCRQFLTSLKMSVCMFKIRIRERFEKGRKEKGGFERYAERKG